MVGVVEGISVIMLGLVIIKFGDREVGGGEARGGIITKLFSGQYVNPKSRASNYKILKWVVGLIAIWFGLGLVLTHGRL